MERVVPLQFDAEDDGTLLVLQLINKMTETYLRT